MIQSSDSLNPATARSEPDAGPTLEWRIHPVTRRPVVSALVSLTIVLFTALVLYSTGSRLFASLSMIVLFASLAKFYFPTAYKLTDKGITVKTTTQTLFKEWSLYRSCWPDKNGILLSPFPEPSRLENFRGLYLIFGGNGEAVIRYVKAHIPSQPEVPKP